MSEVRFYADEHIARSVVVALRNLGLDVLTVKDAKLMGANDLAHLAKALEDGRVIVTHDQDFLSLSRQGHKHVGIAYAPHGAEVGRIVRGLVLFHGVLGAEDMMGSIEFL